MIVSACWSAWFQFLTTGDYNAIADFRVAAHSYHVLFKMLYPLCCKTKLHCLQHVADSWEFWKLLINCFSPERNHRIMKGVMRFAYKKAPNTALAYAIRTWLSAITAEHAFSAVHFVGTVFSVQARPILLPAHGEATILEWCPKLRLPCGLICVGDLLRYQSSLQSSTGFGFAIGFAKLQVSTGYLFIAVITVCKLVAEPIDDVRHWRDTGQYGMLTSGQVQASVPLATFGGTFVPCDV